MQEIKGYSDEPVSISVWIPITTPFAFGGQFRNVKTEALLYKLYIVRDILLGIITNPDSSYYYIIDIFSGGTVGGGEYMMDALRTVATEITSSTKDGCKKQQMEAKRQLNGAHRVSLEEFWSFQR